MCSKEVSVGYFSFYNSSSVVNPKWRDTLFFSVPMRQVPLVLNHSVAPHFFAFLHTTRAIKKRKNSELQLNSIQLKYDGNLNSSEMLLPAMQHKQWQLRWTTPMRYV